MRRQEAAKQYQGTNRRRTLLLGVFAVLSCIGFLLSIVKGSVEIPPEEICRAVMGGA